MPLLSEGGARGLEDDLACERGAAPELAGWRTGPLESRLSEPSRASTIEDMFATTEEAKLCKENEIEMVGRLHWKEIMGETRAFLVATRSRFG